MQCPYCAETIQDRAIVCRYCGARKLDEQWAPPTVPVARPAARKGAFTIKTAGITFLLSSAVSFATLTSPVAFGGAMRTGAPAVTYNLALGGLFAAMGVGLLIGKMWGYNTVLIGTALYTIKEGLFLLNKATRDAYLQASGITGQVKDLIGGEMIDQYVLLLSTAMLACWWGFALYLYWRRSYFQSSQSPPARAISSEVPRL